MSLRLTHGLNKEKVMKYLMLLLLLVAPHTLYAGSNLDGSNWNYTWDVPSACQPLFDKERYILIEGDNTNRHRAFQAINLTTVAKEFREKTMESFKLIAGIPYSETLNGVTYKVTLNNTCKGTTPDNVQADILVLIDKVSTR